MKPETNHRLPQLYPWHKQVWHQLLGSEAAGRLPHALLLAGCRGMGKTELAQLWVYHSFCLNQDKSALGHTQQNGSTAGEESVEKPFCGQCKNCHLLMADSHPDLRRLGLAEDKKQISVDQVRSALEFATAKPQIAPMRVVIVEEAEHLNLNAANALLKALEEPAPGSRFMLTSARLSSLLPTIKSRCQILPLSPQTAPAMAWLNQQTQDQQTLDETALETALQLSWGGPLAALGLLKDQRWQDWLRLMNDLQALSSDEINELQMAERWYKYDLGLLLDWLYWLAKQVIERLSGAAPAHRALGQWGRELDPKRLTGWFGFQDEIAAHLQRVATLGSNLNQRLLIDGIFLKMAALLGK